MVHSNATAALQSFVDDEFMRAPLLVDQVVEAALDHIRKALPGLMPHERTVASELLQSAQSNRQRLVDYYVRSLREQVQDTLARRAPPQAAAAPAAAPLSLLDEDEVAVDVAISHTIEAIRSIAEYEMRELQTFTSALVGDMDVTRDHNPFKPEAHTRALWAAAQALPLSRGYQLSFMRHCSRPLAQVLRKTFASASSRLEAAGVEPASHRTLILPAGSRRARPSQIPYSPDLNHIRQSMPVRATPATPQPPLEQVLKRSDDELRSLPPDTGHAEFGRLRERLRERLVESATSPVDQQLIEMLSRLFDAILTDPQLAPDIQLLLSRLQSSLLRVALRDPTALDQASHATWRFMDAIAFLGEVLPEAGDPQRERTLRFVRDLIDHVLGEPEQNEALYDWAISRLKNHERHRFERRTAAAAPEIASLQQLEDRLAASQTPLTTMSGALDVPQLDTVPAELFDELEPASRKPEAAALAWLNDLRPADWVRVFLQGHWVTAQLLWPGDRGEIWLFGDGASGTTWAVRRRALLTLLGENLLDAVEPRSLLGDAAKRVMRRIGRPS